MSSRLGGGNSSRRVPLSCLYLLLLPSFVLSLHICNGGTDYACICDNSTSSPLAPPPLPPPCSHFIESEWLPSVDMRVRHVNLEATRGGDKGEKYERYFKKRIATIVSAYCERKTNECPGMALVLNPDNVILLRTHSEPHNITRILFNIVKSGSLAKAAMLSQDNILDPVKVKYILGSHPGPLSRILGGVGVESVRVNNVHGETVDIESAANGDKGEKGAKDNRKLKWMLAIVGTFFLFCYAIGGYKLWSDCHKRNKNKKATESSHIINKEPEAKNTNYGSIVTHQPNGSTVVTVMETGPQTSPVMGHCYTRPSSSLDASTLPRAPLSQRQALLMFGCDPSQLPKEMSIDTGLDDLTPSTACQPSPSTCPPIPAVVLLSSHSLSRDSPLADPLPSSTTPNDKVPIHRPKSRRGSRVDDGIEAIDITERTVQSQFNESVDHLPLHKRLTDEAWSSSEGEVDVYYKLSEEECDGAKGDEWPTVRQSDNDPSNIVIFSPPRKNRDVIQDDDDSSDDEMERVDIVEREESSKGSIDVRDEDEIHAYERLREELSPHPPHTSQFSTDSQDMQ